MVEKAFNTDLLLKQRRPTRVLLGCKGSRRPRIRITPSLSRERSQRVKEEKAKQEVERGERTRERAEEEKSGRARERKRERIPKWCPLRVDKKKFTAASEASLAAL
jgi:hypothetical protein